MSARQDILDIADDLERNVGFADRAVARLRAVAESLTVPEDGANKHAAESAKNAHDQSIRLGTVDAVLDLGRESAISWQAFRYIEYQAKQIDAHKERAIAAESKLAALTERCEALTAALNGTRRHMGFLKSVIQSGEHWSEQAEREHNGVNAVVDLMIGAAEKSNG